MQGKRALLLSYIANHCPFGLVVKQRHVHFAVVGGEKEKVQATSMTRRSGEWGDGLVGSLECLSGYKGSDESRH